MSKKTYSEKLKSPKWQKKRLEILNRDNFTCQHCFSEEKTLHVHHMVYFNNQEPWDCDNLNLITICNDCHKLAHSKDEHTSKAMFMKLWFVIYLNTLEDDNNEFDELSNLF